MTEVACLLKTENCVPCPLGVAPKGSGFPGNVRRSDSAMVPPERGTRAKRECRTAGAEGSRRLRPAGAGVAAVPKEWLSQQGGDDHAPDPLLGFLKGL